MTMKKAARALFEIVAVTKSGMWIPMDGVDKIYSYEAATAKVKELTETKKSMLVANGGRVKHFYAKLVLG